MRILIHGINFSPELTGIGKYTGEMAEWFSQNGHRVEVITAPPYYPQWKVHSTHRNWWQVEKKPNLRIMRGPIYVPANVTSIRRILHECSFTLSTLAYWVRAVFIPYDVVVVVCPVLQSGLIPTILRRFKKFKLIVHVQDLQVDAAKQLGMVKSSKLIQLLERIEKFIFNQSDFVSTISEGMKNKILSKGIPADKIILFKNWVNTATVYPISSDDILPIKHKLGYTAADFVVLYSGNMGEKQGLDMILEVADRLKQNDGIKFLLVGDGSSKLKLVDRANHMGLKNVKFMPLVPLDELNDLLNSASVHLVLQKKGATDLVMPSKLGGILSSGGFVIVAADPVSDLYQIVEKNQLGMCIATENESELLASITKSQEIDLTTYKNYARNYALTKLSKEPILREFEVFIKSSI